MDKKAVDLIEKTCDFLKERDIYKLEYIIKDLENKYPKFCEILEKYKVKHFFDKLSVVLNSLVKPSVPLGVMGKKLEEDKIKEEILLQKKNLIDEANELLKENLLSKETKEFLEYFFKNI